MVMMGGVVVMMGGCGGDDGRCGGDDGRYGGDDGRCGGGDGRCGGGDGRCGGRMCCDVRTATTSHHAVSYHSKGTLPSHTEVQGHVATRCRAEDAKCIVVCM